MWGVSVLFTQAIAFSLESLISRGIQIGENLAKTFIVKAFQLGAKSELKETLVCTQKVYVFNELPSIPFLIVMQRLSIKAFELMPLTRQ